MLGGVHTVLEHRVLSWESGVHLTQHSIKPAEHAPSVKRGQRLRWRTLAEPEDDQACPDICQLQMGSLEPLMLTTSTAAEAQAMTSTSAAACNGTAALSSLLAALFSERSSNAPDEGELEPQLNHARIVFSVIRADPIFWHSQSVEQACQGAHTAQAVCGHQLRAVQALVLQAGLYVPADQERLCIRLHMQRPGQSRC